MSSFIRFYKKLLRKHTFLTQATQAGLFMGTSDLIAQKFVERKSFQHINFKRTVQFSLVGSLSVGPVLILWYRYLDTLIKVGSKSSIVIRKLLIDQCLFAPILYVHILTSIGVAQGKTVDEIKTKLKNDYPDIIKANYFVWPWVNLTNFCLVPLQYRILLNQTVALFWNTFISWRTNRVNGIQN